MTWHEKYESYLGAILYGPDNSEINLKELAEEFEILFPTPNRDQYFAEATTLEQYTEAEKEYYKALDQAEETMAELFPNFQGSYPYTYFVPWLIKNYGFSLPEVEHLRIGD